MRSDVSRRSLLGAAGGVGLAMATGASGQFPGGQPVQAPRADGKYDTISLAKESWTLGVVQARALPVNLGRVDASRTDNLAHMVRLIDAAFAFGPGPDVLLFHEFPITGFGARWTRKDVLKAAIEIPGAETERLAAKARQHGVYLVFGSYARDVAWPGHALSITTIIGPDGRILARDWKARNIKGVFGGEIELFTTTIYDVLDRYVEMYGRDAVVPVHRTPIGNLATSSVQREPELFRAMALKGAEVMLRTATGGFSSIDIAATSLYNGVYTAIANNAISPGSPFFEDSNAGNSAVYDPNGEVIAIAQSPNETLVQARIPIGSFRERHRQPSMHTPLYRDILNAYAPQYPPNLFAGYLPEDLKDAGRYLRDKGTWK